jgi:hypothetical protein
VRNTFSTLAIVFLALVAGASSAHGDRTRVDWERGLLIGRGIAVGDLRSPSRQLARVKAERQAKDQCRKLLLKSVSGMPWAEVGKGGEASQHDSLVSAVFELHTDYGTDGSVVVEMALPLDALRALAYGPDALEPDPSDGPSALLIDARASGVKPALGYLLRGQSGDYRGPTLFFTSEKDARKHAGVGKEAPLLVAKAGSKQDRKGGAILVETDAFQKLTASRPLIAIIWRDQK